MFVGLVLGGVLAPIDWRLVFLISVPVGLFGTDLGLHEARGALATRASAERRLVGQRDVRARADPDHGLRDPRHPARTARHALGWTSPTVIALLAGAVVCLVAFVLVERRVENPMFELPLFRIRAFTFGTLSTFLSAVARGGLMFMLIIWLQGIWLPQHGYTFTETPLWAGIYMLPLTVGMLMRRPDVGLSERPLRRALVRVRRDDRRGARASALLWLLPTDFAYPLFAAILAVPDRALDGHVRLAQPRGDHEQPAEGAPRRRRGDEPDVPELRPGALDRHLLHADDRRARRDAAGDAERAGCRRTASPPRPPSTSARCRRSRSCSPPSWATTRSRACSARTRSTRSRRTTRPR